MWEAAAPKRTAGRVSPRQRLGQFAQFTNVRGCPVLDPRVASAVALLVQADVTHVVPVFVMGAVWSIDPSAQRGTGGRRKSWPPWTPPGASNWALGARRQSAGRVTANAASI